MFKKFFLIVLAGILAAILCIPLRAETKKVGPFLIEQDQQPQSASLGAQLSGFGQASSPQDVCPFTASCLDAAPGDPCDVTFAGPGMAWSYQDPAKNCPPLACPTVYPFEVNAVHVLLSNCDPSVAVVMIITPGIWAADFTDLDCVRPGGQLCTGPTIQITIPPNTSCQEFVIPLEDSCCVDTTYFASITVDFPTQPGGGICHDITCDLCCDYVFDGVNYVDLCPQGFPGNLAIWTDGFLSCQSVCEGPPSDTGKNHYKTWSISGGTFNSSTPQVKDQFMTDSLQLIALRALSNPVRKIVGPDTFNIVDPDDHLTWYAVSGRDTLLNVEYVNQFESTTVVIDSVHYLLVPAQKDGHPPSDSLDHYKAYRIRNPVLLNRAVQLQDQFDAPNTEQITSFLPVYFLTPAQKNLEPVYDQVTHYLAYAIAPSTGFGGPDRTVTDQFNAPFGTLVRPIQSVFLLVPTKKIAFAPPECSDGADNDGDGLVDFPADCGCTDPADNTEAPNPPTQCSDGVDNDGDGLTDLADPDCANVCDDEEGVPQTDTGPNHFKTWRIQPVPFTVTVALEDQFLKDSNVRLDGIEFLSNPVRKIVFDPLGLPDTFNITDPDAHLNWYKAVGKRTKLKVAYQNQFESTSVLIDSLKYLLVPAQKLPHPAPDSLDHYKCYRICNPTLFNKAVLLDDQFDLTQEQITSMSATYFCTPVIKNTEPRYDSVTHYVAYSITPGSTTNESRTTIDQFGQHPAQALFSQYLLVPTEKLGVLCDAIPGDANADLALSLADVISIKNYIFNTPGCLPLPLCWLSGKICRGDTDGNGVVSLADVIRLVNYIFAKPCAPGVPGTPPCCWKPLPAPGSTCCLPVPFCDPGCP
jgi:hypothetical protein